MPTCGLDVPRTSVAENEAVNFTCKMTYRWLSVDRLSNIVPNIHESFGWVEDTGTLSSRTLLLSDASKQTVVQTMTLAAAKLPEILAQNCTLNFTFAIPPQLAALYSFAVNPVSYTCITDPIPVRRKFHCAYYCNILSRVLTANWIKPRAFANKFIPKPKVAR